MIKKTNNKKTKITEEISSSNHWWKKGNLSMPKINQIIKGRILEKSKNNISVDLGVFGIGKILTRELKENPRAFEELKVSDEIEATILNEDNEEGFIELSLVAAKQETILNFLKESFYNRKPIEVKVIGANKGGLVVNHNEIEGFLPLSHLNEKHYPQAQGDQLKIINELRKLMGENLKVGILNLNLREKKFIVSEKYL